MRRFARPALAPWILLSFTGLAFGGDRYVVVPFESLHLEGETAPDAGGAPPLRYQSLDAYDAYVVLDGAGEAFLDFEGRNPWDRKPREPARCAVRAPEGAAIAGRVFVARPDYAGFESRRFTLDALPADADAKVQFYTIMEAHYRRLLERDLPGAAWFRHQVAAARAARGAAPGGSGDTDGSFTTWRSRPEGFEDTFDLFTGERALAENLDIDRALRNLKDEKADVDVASIQGVTTRAMDWKALVKNLKPERDALASLVPADQHGLFFPSFDAMTRVFDEIDQAGTPLVQFAAARAEDLRTKERYQEQLCLPLSTVARLLGPAVVQSVAITGSDAYLPSGSDLALLFDCKEAALLEKLVQARHLEAQGKGAKPVSGKAGAVAYTGVRSDDRRVSSYLVRIGNTIVVSNSPAQLERIAATAEKREPALGDTDEYVWFRDRYKKGDAEESALLVLSDATIRRWASPRARIADSRRVRAAAAMAEVEARHLDDLVRRTIRAGAAAGEADLPLSADFVWDATGVRSPLYGTPTFLTPVAELVVDRVTPSEKAAYESFRAVFQDRWRAFFDPIAVRLSFSDARLGADVTVMPLAVSTEYQDLRDLTRDATLGAEAGDPHEGTLFHFAIAFGKAGWLSRMFSREAGPFAQQLGADPLGWIGGGAALYAEKDPFWEKTRGGASLEDNFNRIPVALHVEVKDALKLTAFLTGLRAMSDGAAPGMARWETKTWHDQSYVRVSAAEGAGLDGPMAETAICYAAMPDAFILSLREDIVQQAIDRRIARKAGKPDAARSKPWLGTSLGLRADRDAVAVLGGMASDPIADELRLAAWSALPILNEWKRRYPAEDPVALHERLWGTRLSTPAAGTFSWNEALQTMETSDYGSPAAPKSGPALPSTLDRFLRGEFGLSFEGEGLRARAELERRAQ